VIVPSAAPPPRADLERYGIRHPRPFCCDVRVGAADVSRAIPHANNADYLRWLDRAAELHSDSVGYTRRTMLDGGIMWFVARHEIDYLAEAWIDDALLVATWVRDVQRVRSWRDSLIVRPADGTVICRCATLWVLVELERRKPIRVPAEMATRFDPLHPPAPASNHPCTSP
jgi:acyl-CoA thioester hydrolase